MEKKGTIFKLFVVCIILGIGCIFLFPEKVFKFAFPTFVETIKGNWGISLPTPDREIDLFSTRGGFQGDGDAITELHYSKAEDIEQIQALTQGWISGKSLNIEQFPERVRILLELEPDASYYFLHEDNFDYIIFELKGDILKIYESYL